ncbi:MAG: O-acetyl-ADP-ribose deacetylase [Armatimonadetes bacterium]|nr:O-acetyl-ADP-ribose deacetylase [Armatimonadota bacterium]
MNARFGETDFTLVEGDITHQDTDAIVNAANTRLMGGSGVDGAIHRAGGPVIMQECKAYIREHGSLPVGEAMMTTGGQLHARYVIHTVGPFWHGGEHGEPEKLASCYRNSLRLALDHGLKTVAFPSISTGVYRYPMDRAARIALGTIRDFCEEHSGLEEVRMVLFGEAALKVYEEALTAEKDRKG